MTAISEKSDLTVTTGMKLDKANFIAEAAE